MELTKHGVMHAYAQIEPILASRGPFDFVFIDAPPGWLGRDSTLFAAAAFLRPRAVVLLDDAARPAEQTTLKRWERVLGVERVYESAQGRGIAVLIAPQSQTVSFSWRTFLGTIHDRIVERVARSQWNVSGKAESLRHVP
jgi:hypothetical protein